MNTRALNSLADLICRAQEQGKRTPMGIAMAIDSAGRHMSPEVAVELEALRVRVAELQAERHTTNEALDDVVRELRVSYAERARRETRPAWRHAWELLARAEESERVADALLAPKVKRRADGVTRAVAASEGPREPDGEFYAAVHHDYRTGRDWPGLGGA